jgi:indolepyruvate ferredoxin oxidoreductase alpha subunit
MSMKILMTGNEAVARGVLEAGVAFAAAYPGTPSTEILENIGANGGGIEAEWTANEKVALESAFGASVAGARSFAAMKHVGLNVAADPLMTIAYTGVNGGFVVVSADEPGLHSSQNEQDNRHYARLGKMPMFEPADSQDCVDMMVAAYDVSERFDVPVLFRMTTRICHSKTPVTPGEVRAATKKPYVRDIGKYYAVPEVAKRLHVALEKKLLALAEFSEGTEFNREEMHDRAIGIVTAGAAYQCAREVFGESASYLKLGFTNPLPMKKIRDFAARVGKLYVVEELDPFMEEQIAAAGIACVGKSLIPVSGELNPEILARALLGREPALVEADRSGLAARPPVLCAGCPHRGFFHTLGKYKNLMITGDIGCYGLGGLPPLNAADTCIAMGASVSMAYGASKVFAKFGDPTRNVAVIGDSTFFHTGMNSLLGAVYNKSNTITCILDNRITGMTGHQENPGTGYTLAGEPTKAVDLEALVRALGVDKVRSVNPNRLDAMKAAFDWAFQQSEPVVIIARWPCVLKKFSKEDRAEFGDWIGLCEIDERKCIGCRACVRTGCPALQYNPETKKTRIDPAQCVGCEVCVQVCPTKAISKAGANHE